MAYKQKVTPEEIEALPLGAFKGEIHVISSYGLDYILATRYLRKCRYIGFDTETKPVFEPHKPHRDVSLLQLSGPDKAFLFRIQKIGGNMSRLCSILSDRRICKVGAASHDDVRGLQKLMKIEEANFVDLQQIVSQWGIEDKSVRKLAANILGVRISKAQQLSNWEADTLSEAQKLYAATDAWVCREMYMKLLSDE